MMDEMECTIFRQKHDTMRQCGSLCRSLLAMGKCASVSLVDSDTGELLATVYMDCWDLSEAGERMVKADQSKAPRSPKLGSPTAQPPGKSRSNDLGK
jgi:hypothetical protein